MNQTSRPALGQVAFVGAFYNAKSDSFLSKGLLSQQPSPGVVSFTEIRKTTAQISYVGTYEERFKQLGIGPELAASILSGLVHPGDAGYHLSDAPGNERVLEAAVYHTIRTGQEKLMMTSSDLNACVGSKHLRTSEVTHIVTEVEYGGQSVVTAKYWLPRDAQRQQYEGQFRQQAEVFTNASQQIRAVGPDDSSMDLITALPVEIIVYSTTLGEEGLVTQDYQEAYEFLELMPSQIRNENAGRGKQIVYKLMPVEMLSFFSLDIQVDADLSPALPSHECLKRLVQLFDEFQVCRQRLDGYQSYVSKNKLYLPPSYVQDITGRVHDMDIAERNARDKYASTLQAVRAGTSDPEKLWQLVTDCTRASLSPSTLSTIADDHEAKVDFVDAMVAKGATYIGYNGLDLRTELLRQSGRDCFVFSFSVAAMQSVPSWGANQDLLQRLLNDSQPRAFVAIVDCDAASIKLERSVISQYRDEMEICGDLYERQQFAAAHCFARHDPRKLETGDDIQKPIKRRFVKIACPGRNCDPHEVCSWICPSCQAPIEYGFSDQYFYCECGRCPCSDYDFMCNADQHGQQFEIYEQRLLLQLLNSLNQSDYVNVLILGETGVGKSTFINAFVNYLHFETLDESMAAAELHYVIPCSFSTQTMNRSGPDGEIEEKLVKVGFRDDENDGSMGSSATQRTQVYPINVGTTTYRLIDTPGIGDTRGIEFDKTNVADILSTLSCYDELHGVLILLKSNNARMTAQFAYCVKDLLTHLHRSAAANMVFGFTNTRISNYTPGDTFGSLRKLLAEHPDVGLSLTNHTAYCFDSESFRYLAAHKKGVYMDNQEDFRRSWKHSRDEAWRMLDHFKVKPPHPVRNTISLNSTRELICELTKPMADISQTIRTNMAMCEDDILKLQDDKLTGDKLRTQLNPKKKCIRLTGLDQPRTVCADLGCVEYKDDGTGTNTMLTDYTQLCHAPCYLTDVKPGVLSHPSLVGCWAFQGSDTCTQCQHHWTQHLHVLTELEDYETAVKDKGIAEQITRHASDIVLKQTAITAREQLIKEYQDEHDVIQQAAAKFGIWLKDNSITPYNDATLAYLDVLINQEEAKASAGYNNEKLLSLRADYEKHKELVAVLEFSMKSNDGYKALDPKGVAQLASDLYKLKHFGKMLENVKLTLAAAHEGTYRERPHHVHSSKNTSSGWTNPITALFSKSPSRHRPLSNGISRPSNPNKSNQMLGFNTGSMRPNSQQVVGRPYSQQMAVRNNLQQMNARQTRPVLPTGPTPRHNRVPGGYSQQQQGWMPVGQTHMQMNGNEHDNGSIVRQNTLQRAVPPGPAASVKSAKSTFSMPSLNPFRKNKEP
jgi:50S ribosome-binding GTPase